jgi:sulfite reductase (NADPH) flavoprotein alpha-component
MTNFDRNNPLAVTIKDRYRLTKASSTKEIWHITLNVPENTLDYHPGDSVGIYAQNDPTLVAHLIEAMQAHPDDLVIHKRTQETLTLSNFLTYRANLSRLTSSFLQLLHDCQECLQIQTLLTDKEKLRAFLKENDPLFLLRDYAKAKLPLQELCDQFGPLLPRFYSVASSAKTQKDTLDLTVALFTWTQGEEKRYGVASHFLCHLATPNETPVPLFVQPALHFRLPSDLSTDLIMIGPGTGIAPFRAFMQERTHHGATGKHHLYFGERSRHTDYLYENEWTAHNNLAIHTAFSRDQEEKIYVQHRLLEHAPEIYRLLESGAHLYVCGDAKVMAKDVEKTLLHILEKEGSLTPESAKDKLKILRKTGQYRLDVY